MTPREQGAAPLVERLLRPHLVAIAVVLAAIALLYGPARAYYAARRDEAAYKVQLAAIVANNEELKADVAHLQTREGIEDEARRHGFVEPGETAVKVAGLEEEQPDISARIGSPTSSEADSPWYFAVLDFLFSYEPVRTAG